MAYMDYPYIWSSMDAWNLVLMGEARTDMYRQLVAELGKTK